MSLAFILLYLTNSEMRFVWNDLFAPESSDIDEIFGSIAGIFCFIAGIIFSIRQIFTNRLMSEFEKTCMLIFAILVNAFSGLWVTLYAMCELQEPYPLFLIFPFLNFVNAMLLIFAYRFGYIGTECICDDKLPIYQYFVGCLAIVVIFCASQFFFELNWAITFSICVSYATTLNSVLEKYILRPDPNIQKEEEFFEDDPNKLLYRKARINEMDQINDIYSRTIRRVNAEDYSSEKIDAWVKCGYLSITQQMLRNAQCFVCVNANRMIGMGGMVNNSIVALYIAPDRMGEGIGSGLLRLMEEDACKRGVKEMLVDSTLTAELFFKAKGYKETGRKRISIGDRLRLDVVAVQRDFL